VAPAAIPKGAAGRSADPAPRGILSRTGGLRRVPPARHNISRIIY